MTLTLLSIEAVSMDTVREMLARRERLALIRDRMALGETESGEVLTEEVDELDSRILNAQQVYDAKIAAFMNGLSPVAGMEVVA